MTVSSAFSQNLALAAGAMRASRRIAIICHASPDPDCVGGLLGLGRVLETMGKVVHRFAPDPVPEMLDFLPGIDQIEVAPGAFPEVDLIILIEAPSLPRVNPVFSTHREQIERTPKVNIDHHVTNEYFGSVNVVEPEMSSVCEILVKLVHALSVPIDAGTATCLLTGIVADTRSFRTPGVTVASLTTAGELVGAGADLFLVNDAVHRTRRIATLRLWASAIDSLASRDGFVIASVTRAMVDSLGLGMNESEGLVEFLSDTRDLDVAVVLKENADGTIRVSMRSTGRVDVAAICARYGGGGHVRAAGCNLPGPIESARDQLFSDFTAQQYPATP
ncbi:MAG TPA: DHH family phosphoesterase [Chloroflexota bacterium]|nr:DHH family phosphoesterase [Chloroflexota bacterium]